MPVHVRHEAELMLCHVTQIMHRTGGPEGFIPRHIYVVDVMCLKKKKAQQLAPMIYLKSVKIVISGRKNHRCGFSHGRTADILSDAVELAVLRLYYITYDKETKVATAACCRGVSYRHQQLDGERSNHAFIRWYARPPA